MKRAAYLLITGLMVILAQTAFAADATNNKIAFIDGAVIIQKYEPEIDAKLQDEFKSTQSKLVDLQKKLVEKTEKYNRDAAVMSEDELADLQKTFEKEQAEYQRLNADYNQKRALRGNEEIEKLLEDVKNTAKKIADKHGYTIVLQKGAAIYIENNNSDITSEVMKQLSYK